MKECYEVSSLLDYDHWTVGVTSLGLTSESSPEVRAWRPSKPLPAVGSFLYRVMIDFQEAENDFGEEQVSGG